MIAKPILLALLGVGLLISSFKFYQSSSAVHYLKNCQLVQPGMTVEQAEKIMNDQNGAHHLVLKGALEYDVPLFARTGTIIYFDPQTRTVKEVICGDAKWSGYDGVPLNN